MLANFLKECERKGYSPLTIRAYTETLTKFLGKYPNFVSLSKRETREAVTEFLHGSPATKNRALSAIKSFYKYLEESEIIELDPVASMTGSKLPERKTRVINKTQLDTLLTPTGNEPVDKRDLAVIALFLATGMRLSELTSLDLSHLKRDNSLTIIGKGNKERTVFMDGKTRAILNRYIAARAKLNPKCNALFLSYKGDRLLEQGVYAIIKDKAGVTPHQLRHTAATSWVEKGMNLETVRKLLGHKSISTTQRYLDVSTEHTRKEYIKANG